MKRSRLVAVAMAAVMLPGLAGCWSGPNAATTTQTASGDGTQVDATDVTIDSATIVAGDPGSGKAAFLGTVYNPTREPDELLGITVDGVAAKLTPEPVELLPLKAVAIQTGKDASAQFEGFTGETGTYVPVTVTFRNAGQQDFTALVVPPAGFYAEAAPEGTRPIAEKVNQVLEHGAEGTAAEIAGTEGATQGETPNPMPSEQPEP